MQNDANSRSSDSVQKILEDAASSAHDIGGKGFCDMQESELREIVAAETNPLSVTEIEEILEDSENQVTKTPNDEPAENILTTKSLAKILNTLQNAIEEALSEDPILTRSLKFRHDCEKAMATY